MIARHRCVRSAMLALAWLVLAAGPVVAHNGEEHGHGSGNTVATWLGIAGVMLLVVLVYRLVWSSDGEATEPNPDMHDRRDER